MNQEVQAYLRHYINHEQSDWTAWLPVAQLALNSRHQPGIGMSPFHATHGYHAPHPIQNRLVADSATAGSDEARARAFVQKIKDITDACQAQMGATVQRQEDSANKKRIPAKAFKVGDKVWLDLRNYTTDRPKRSLDYKHAKYTVSDVLSPLSIRLQGIPRGIHPVFHPDLLRLAEDSPLPGQWNDDSQPNPVIIEGEPEWEVERILGVRPGGRKNVKVKWKGYHEPTWEPVENLKDTDAWKRYADSEAQRHRA